MATVVRRGGGRRFVELGEALETRPVSTRNKSKDRTRASSNGQLSKRRDELRVLFVPRSLLLTPYNGRDGVSQLGSLPLAATGAAV